MDSRFEVFSVDNLGKIGVEYIKIFVFRDKETGVLYLHNRVIDGVRATGGLTPLLDSEGKIVVLLSCPECGTQISKEMKICPECGYPLEEE